MAALPLLDWSRPWLSIYRERGERVAAAIANGASVAAALQAELDAGGAPIRLDAGALRFVPHATMPPGIAYESSIVATACVPTRDNLHDLFNGLVWLHHPALKTGLNRWQAAEIERDGVGPARGPLRDAMTLFDENGALLQAPTKLIDALRARDWQRLFITHRDEWRHASITLFGHALMEKLAHPRKPITAHVWVVDASDPLAGLGPQRLVVKPFLPLPILGVPGWWPANDAPAFYDDEFVFRRPAQAAGSAGRKPSIER